jgi:hypothetical protein
MDDREQPAPIRQTISKTEIPILRTVIARNENIENFIDIHGAWISVYR